MSYTIKQLDKTYNRQLLSLAGNRNTGSMLFNTNRSPDFFALSAELGDTKYFGIFKNEQIIGCIGVATQPRIINSSVVNSYYLFDLKVHSGWSGSPAFYRLIQHVVSYYKEFENAQWMFSTILDSNTHISPLTKGADLFPQGKLIGKNYHIGFPLFTPLKSIAKGSDIKKISGEEAWIFYKAHVPKKNFAPHDKALFLKENGFFLGCYKNDDLVAICKLTDQSHARQIVLTQRQHFSFKLLNLFCKYYNCPPLPKLNEVFKHGYLSYYIAKENIECRSAFLKYIQKNFANKYSYIFAGFSEKESREYKSKLLIKFTSSTYGYGELPQNILLGFSELTLI